MEYNYLSGTGLKVSRVCIGAMTFGGKLDEAAVRRVVDYALGEGVNFFDTADQYVDGVSETLLGNALGERRRDVVVASKVGFPVRPHFTENSLSRARILRACDDSLKRLGTDYLDIYYLHQPDYNTPLEESLSALNDLVRAGKVRYTGMSNYAAWQVCDAVHICRRNGWTAPVVTEVAYNALTRGAEQELVPFLLDKKIGMTIFNPLAGGMLTGKFQPDVPPTGTRFENPNYQKRYWKDENFRAIERMKEIAAGAGIDLVELSMRWCLSQAWVSAVITGFSSEEQLRHNMAGLQNGPLPAELLPAVDEVWGMVNGGRVPYNR